MQSGLQQGEFVKLKCHHPDRDLPFMDTAEPYHGTPSNGVRLGTRTLAVREAFHDASHGSFVTKDWIQMACAVCPPVVSLHYLPFEIQNGLRARGYVSDVGNFFNISGVNPPRKRPPRRRPDQA